MKAKIQTLVFPLLLGFTAVAASALSGCVVDNRTNPPSGSCVDQRFATVGWRIVKNVNNVELSCAQANAAGVYLYFGPYTYTYNCEDYGGTTDSGLPPGNYTTSMQLVSPNGQVLSDTAVPAGPTSFPIYSCAPDDIPTVTFGVL
jgi:hypothetical protein